MHSAWIGEHHFNSLGVLSCPDLVLAYVAANTTRIRLAPAVTVLPLHHPIRVAEQWATLDLLSGGRVDFAAGRGYDQREYLPFHVSFDDNQGIFEEGLELVRRAVGGRRPHLASRQTLFVRRRAHHAEAGAAADPDLCRLVLQAVDRACGAARLRPDRGAVRRRHELWRARSRSPTSITRPAPSYGNKPGRLMCSYFTHFADDKAQEDAQRARQIRYYKECVIPAFPGDPKTAPPSYRYFIDMVERLQKVRPEDLTENSVLLGSPARIIDTLKKVEAAGFVEVILYFNVGLKPHDQVKDEMARFMAEVAPAFAGAKNTQHSRRPAGFARQDQQRGRDKAGDRGNAR